MIRLVFALAVVLLLGGCLGVKRRLSTIVPSYASLPNGRDPRNPAQYSEIGKRFLARGITPTLEDLHKRRLNILEISGGLWGGRADRLGESGTRPKFDVVTGISAGALLSTFAFLGEPEDDAVIVDLFTGMKKGDVAPKTGGVLRFAFGDDSLMDNKPLIEKLRQLITEKNIARVAAEAHKGRLLFVGLLILIIASYGFSTSLLSRPWTDRVRWKPMVARGRGRRCRRVDRPARLETIEVIYCHIGYVG